MAILTIASKAKPALILPVVNAAAYVSTDPEYGFGIVYKDAESVGTQGEKLSLQTDNGDHLIE